MFRRHNYAKRDQEDDPSFQKPLELWILGKSIKKGLEQATSLIFSTYLELISAPLPHFFFLIENKFCLAVKPDLAVVLLPYSSDAV